MAVANYHSSYNCYPPAYVSGTNGKPMHSWRVLILPFIEQKELYDQYDFTQPWNSEENLALADPMPSIYAFHGEHRPGLTTTNYLAVVGGDAFWQREESLASEDITDNPATTILFVENTGQDVHWMQPRDLDFETMSLVVNSPDGVSSKYLAPAVVMLDGTLRKLQNELSENTFRALLTANGGEQIREEGAGWRLLQDGRMRTERD